MTFPIDTAAADLVERFPVGLGAADAEGRVCWANGALGRMLDSAAEVLHGCPLARLLGARAESVAEGAWRGVIRDGSGERRWLELRTVALPQAVAGATTVFSVSDITAFESRGRARAAVAAGIDASRIDADTGLLNRRATLQELNAQVSRSRRYGNPLSLLCVQVDDGDGDGDGERRRRVAQHLRESLRWVDSAGTLDAESMVVVLPETGAEAAGHVAGKLRDALAADTECASLAERISVTAWAHPDDVGAMLARLRERDAQKS